MWILDIRAFSNEMTGSATPVFPSFYVTFVNSKSGLEVNSWFHVLTFRVFTRNQADETLLLLLDKLPLALQNLPLTLHLNFQLRDNFCWCQISYIYIIQVKKQYLFLKNTLTWCLSQFYYVKFLFTEVHFFQC